MRLNKSCIHPAWTDFTGFGGLVLPGFSKDFLMGAGFYGISWGAAKVAACEELRPRQRLR